MTHPARRSSFRFGGLIGLILAAALIAGLACQVPVFRFALERWEADRYSLVIVPGADGKLSPDEEKIRRLLESNGDPESGIANITVRIDSEKVGEGPSATIRLFYPPGSTGGKLPPIWSGPLTTANAEILIDSPARREIVARLLKGESAVWILIESGNKEKDDRAAAEIEKAFERAEAKLKIPDGVLTVEEARRISPNDDRHSDDALRSRIPLKIDFSLLRVSRDDPKESVFREMLLNMEDDLGDFRSEPMVFPVFGRGRALEPLIARGISHANVFEHTSYFCGACSCEIKKQNPGIDLLIQANWEAAMSGSEVVIEKSLPPLPGIGALDDPEENKEGGTSSYELSIHEPWLIAGGGLLLTLGFGTVLILRKNNGHNV